MLTLITDLIFVILSSLFTAFSIVTFGFFVPDNVDGPLEFFELLLDHFGFLLS